MVNHDARDDEQLEWLGWHDGDVPVLLNRTWLASDVRITTGFVEPHFFAGFSGGPKMVAPGLAGLETVLALHNAGPHRQPDRATWGVIEGNPVHDSIRSLVDAHGPAWTSRFDVALNRDQEIVAVFGGDLGADAPRRHRGGPAAVDAAGSPPLRCGGHLELGLSARPEPVPGGEGHVRRGRGGGARWHDHLRRRVP